MTSDSNGNNKNSDQFKEAIKSAVDSANVGLEKLQTKFNEVKRPIDGTLHQLQDGSASLAESAKTLYQRRHEYAPEIIGGTAVTTGGYFWLRRGRIAGVLGATLGAGAAYAVVYDELDLEKTKEMVFGKK